MAKDYAKSFYNSKAWKDCRDGYIKHVLGLCERCKEPGYIVHHKVHITEENIGNPDITLNWDNLRYLCLECHNIEHAENNPVREDLMFTADGQLIAK